MTTVTTAPHRSTNRAAPRTSTPTTAGRRLARALSAELIKLTTVRAYGVIALLTVVVGGLATFGVARYVTDEVVTVATLFPFALVFTAVFGAVAGILVHTSDEQHGTLIQALAAEPRRTTVATARTVVAAGYGATLGAVGLVAGVVGAAAGGIPTGDTSTMLATSAWALAFTTISAVLGLGVGMVARHSTGAVSGLLVWWLVVENLLSALLDARVARFLPFVAGNGLLEIVADSPEELAVALTRPQNALVFGGYALAALVVGTVLLSRRDHG